MPKQGNDFNSIYTNYTILPVIASFDSTGKIRPLYVRIHGESYKICSSQEKPSFVFTSVFQCQVADHGLLKPLLLTYKHRECIWMAEKWDIN